MYLSIIILPLLGSIFSGFLGRKIGQTGANFITIFSLSGSAILSTFVFYEVCLLESPVYIQLNNWINSEFLSVSWYFLFDQLSCFMIIMITYITTLILIYTTYYMAGDPHVQRFMSYLSAFAGFMLILVTGGNYFVMFLGWEGELSCPKWIPNLLDISYMSLYLSKHNKRFFHIEGKVHSHKRIGPHNLNVIQVIIGSLLGDGHLEKRAKGIGCRLIIEQTNQNIEYLMWLYNFFYTQGYCTNLKPKLFKRIKKNNVIYYGIKFNTYTFSSLNWLHNLFYSKDKIKHLPISLLYDYLNPMALSIWFMDDGSKLGSGFKIATNCFKFYELEELCNLLHDKFKLKCSLHKSKLSWTIYIKKDSAKNFANLIEPFMIDSMKYKLGIYRQH